MLVAMNLPPLPGLPGDGDLPPLPGLPDAGGNDNGLPPLPGLPGEDSSGGFASLTWCRFLRWWITSSSSIP